MITLITGTPGAGKTLYAVRMLVEEILKDGSDRPVFANINGLNIDNPRVTVLDPDGDLPLKWTEYPDGAIFIFDEVQRQYPPRNGASKVPAYLQALETHRHRNVDLVFITQYPTLLDRHIMPLVGRHIHLYSPFRGSVVRTYEWSSVNMDPNPSQTMANTDAKIFKYPRSLYGVYTSAVEHNKKLHIPRKLLLFPALALLMLVGSGYMLLRPGGLLNRDEAQLSPSPEPVDAKDRKVPGLGITASLPCAVPVAYEHRAVWFRRPDGELLSLPRDFLADIFSANVVEHKGSSFRLCAY